MLIHSFIHSFIRSFIHSLTHISNTKRKKITGWET